MTRRGALASMTGALTLVLAFTSASYGAAAHRGLQVLDACDGPSFNVVIGPGTCERNGGVTFDKFIGQLVTMGQAPAWRFSPGHLSLASGGTITASNRGGEFHTVTEVAQFGGGCVPELNQILGLSPVPECADPSVFGTTGIVPSGELVIAPDGAGVHNFMCLIHPWMRTTVTVD